MSIYNLLLSNGSMTASEIGAQLDILPNAVYRANKQLLSIGIIDKSDTYPVTFNPVPVSSALGWFLIEAQRNFRQTFGDGNQVHNLTTSPKITFIKNRTDLLNRTDKDAISATKEIKFIVSGLEVPDSTVLAYRKAITKGVEVKALVQKRKANIGRLEQWQDFGVEVRQVNDLELRLFIIDSRIVYMTSYSQNKKEAAFGIRFEYPPFAALMSELFEQKWLSAQ